MILYEAAFIVREVQTYFHGPWHLGKRTFIHANMFFSKKEAFLPPRGHVKLKRLQGEKVQIALKVAAMHFCAQIFESPLFSSLTLLRIMVAQILRLLANKTKMAVQFSAMRALHGCFDGKRESKIQGQSHVRKSHHMVRFVTHSLFFPLENLSDYRREKGTLKNICK